MQHLMPNPTVLPENHNGAVALTLSAFPDQKEAHQHLIPL